MPVILSTHIASSLLSIVAAFPQLPLGAKSMGLVGNNMTTGIRTTNFYPPNFSVPGSMDWASQNASIGQATGANDDNHAGASGIAGGAWLVGIIVALVLLRVAYEYA